MIKKALIKLKQEIKKEIFGESLRGEKVIIPDLRKRNMELDKRISNRQITEDYNRWCQEMNFGGMYVKKY